MKILLREVSRRIHQMRNIRIESQSLISHIKGRTLPRLKATKNKRGFWQVEESEIGPFLKNFDDIRMAFSFEPPVVEPDHYDSLGNEISTLSQYWQEGT